MTARTYARVKWLLVPQGKDHYGMRIDLLSNEPSLMFTRNPGYPPEMMRNRSEGTVYMSAIVEPDGSLAPIGLKKVGLSQHDIVNTSRAT